MPPACAGGVSLNLAFASALDIPVDAVDILRLQEVIFGQVVGVEVGCTPAQETSALVFLFELAQCHVQDIVQNRVIIRDDVAWGAVKLCKELALCGCAARGNQNPVPPDHRTLEFLRE